MNQNQNPEAIASTQATQAKVAKQELPIEELVTTTATETKVKKAKKNKAAKAKKTAQETAAPEKAKKIKGETAPEIIKEVKLKKKKSAKAKAVTETAEQQKPSIMEEVISHRDVKYLYPEDVTDTLSRKTWRQKTRNKLRTLERDMLRIQDQNSKEFKKAKKAYEEFRDSVLKPAQAV